MTLVDEKRRDRADELAEEALNDAKVKIVPDPSSARGQVMAVVIAAAIRKGMIEVATIARNLIPTDSPLYPELEQALRGPALDAHRALHRLWSKAVGTPNYVKQEWRELDLAIDQLVRAGRKERL